MTPELLYHVEDGAAWLTINRPRAGCRRGSRWSCSSPPSRSPPAAPTRSAWSNDVVPLEELHERVRRLTATVTANAPLSVRAGKAMVYAAAEHGRTEAFALAERIWEPVYHSADAQEGPRAFADERTPRWQGR